MLRVVCPCCGKNHSVPSVSELIKKNIDKVYPYTININCCDQKKMNVLLNEDGGVEIHMIDI